MATRPLIERVIGAMLVILIAGAVSSCKQSDSAPAQNEAPLVNVAHPVEHEVAEWDDYTGHLESPEMVQVMARVSGLLISAPFQEGVVAHQGDLLFQIDPAPFKADLDSKLADVAKDEAQVNLTAVQFKRYEELRAAKSISEQDYDNVRAAYQQAQAVLAGAKAAAELARLNLEWTRVVAPITGRTGRKNVTPGNLVTGGAGQATLLTTIQSLDPMYCYVDVDERSVLRYQQLIRDGKIVSARQSRVRCFLQLANESTFPHEGYIDFVDNHVDPTTGTMRIRGVFANPQVGTAPPFFTPGMFARMRIPGSGRYGALLVPDLAVGTDQSQKFLMVVGKDNTAEYRPVQLGALFGQLRAIERGVTKDDSVIVNGILKARPGMKVDPVEQPTSIDSLPVMAPGPPTTGASPETRNAPTTGEASSTLPATRGANP